MRRKIRNILLFMFITAVMVTTAGAVDYDSMSDREEALEIQAAASEMADAARELGYSEDSFIIKEAQAHWWEAQEAIDWHNLTVEQRCFEFFACEMGLNTAAASGILANIYAESSFDYTADGPWGYGLVQWCGTRRESAESAVMCFDNEFAGQLLYIQRELEGDYAHVLEKLEAVLNDASGACEAARIFCLEYEIPANKDSKANYRGKIAEKMFALACGE